METQQITSSQMPNLANSNSFLKAQHFGFRFKEAEKKYNKRCTNKEEIIEDIGERPKPAKVVLSFICLTIALIFAFIETFNIQATIVSALGVGEIGGFIIGIGFALSGLVAGHLLATSWKCDEFTSKFKPTPLFYIGVAFTSVYLLGQYYLASRAGIGAEDMQETVTTIKWFVLGVAVLEVLFGIAFLAVAIKVLTLSAVNLRIKSALSKMKKTSKACDTAWQRYEFDHSGQNMHNPSSAITDARRFYNTGILDEQNIHLN
jgi:hypothetical protein